MPAQNFTCSRCKKLQPWTVEPAFLTADYSRLLCRECGTSSREQITIEWKEVGEPTNLRCSKCLEGIHVSRVRFGIRRACRKADSMYVEFRHDPTAGGVPWACVQHGVRLCARCGTVPVQKEHHLQYHGGGAMHIKMYLVEAAARVAPVDPKPMRAVASSTRTSGIEARGFRLYLPPNTIKAGFFMLEEDSKTFYEVNAALPELGNPASWASGGLSRDSLGQDLAILIPVTLDAGREEELRRRGIKPDFEVGRLVSISRIRGREIHGRVLGKVNINPSHRMNWEVLKDMKKEVLPDEMRNGLLKSLWADMMPYQRSVHPQVLARMTRRWHVDPVALSQELDDMFASGKEIHQGEVRWVVDGL